MGAADVVTVLVPLFKNRSPSTPTFPRRFSRCCHCTRFSPLEQKPPSSTKEVPLRLNVIHNLKLDFFAQ